MDLKKFKKNTNSLDKLNKIKSYNFSSAFEFLYVTKIINYYTFVGVVYNEGNYHKWLFFLNDVFVLDDKLTETNRDFLKKKMEILCLNQYFKFSVKAFNNKSINVTLFIDDTTINIILINMAINIIIVKDKADNDGTVRLNKNKILYKSTKLSTIMEDEEVEDYEQTNEVTV